MRSALCADRMWRSALSIAVDSRPALAGVADGIVTRRSMARSILCKAARRLDGKQFAEVEIDDRLQSFASAGVAQRLG